MAASTTERLYEKPWKLLKNDTAYSSDSIKQTSKVRAEVTKSTSSEVIKKHANTFVRGIQKEKYNDGKFRRQYPSAELTSEINYNTGEVTVTLSLNASTSLADI